MPHRLHARCATALLLLASACVDSAGPSTEVSSSQQALAGDAAAGSIPEGLPARLQVGLFEDTGQTWMRDSGVEWDMRYRYFTKGWVNNWGYGTDDGTWGLRYLRECDDLGFTPVVQYYQMQGEPGGGENAFLGKVQNASTMASYFRDFRVLMERAKEFAKPAVVLLEADGPGFLQSQTGSNPNAYAAIADSGLPELAGLPNTVAGWGLAFLAIREAVGADNVVLGLHVSAWASGRDIVYFNVNDPLQPEVDAVYAFLAPLGLADNVTGSTYDVLVGDPLDRDADYYRLVQGQDRWWDPSDSAPIASKSFNRYAEWLRLWNQTAATRWVLWQIPLGNSASLNVYNNGGPGQGYKDNRSEYFFAEDGAAHREKFADAGVIALLFGAGAAGQATFRTDIYSDGQLFLQSRAGAFLNAGGLAIEPGGNQGSPDAGTEPEDAGSETDAGTEPEDAGSETDAGADPDGGTEPDGGTDPGPPAFDFETGTQAWAVSGPPIFWVSRTSVRATSGNHSLALSLVWWSPGTTLAYVQAPAVPSGSTITFQVWVPTQTRIQSVQAFAQQGAAGGWAWSGDWRPRSALQQGAWNTFTVQLPPDSATPLSRLGVEITTSGPWIGNVFVDAVDW